MPARELAAWIVSCVASVMLGHAAVWAQAQPRPAMTVQNECAEYVIGSDGSNLHFTDRRTGTDYCAPTPRTPFARVKKAGKEHGASAAAHADGLLTAQFGDAGVTATVKVRAEKRHFVFEIVSVTGDGVEEFMFVDLPLTVKGTPEEPFAACALALNLQTRVQAIPRATSRLRASCYPKFGFAGAKAAIIGCPQGELRQVMQEVVSAAPELPHSPIGGPWALDGPNNYGSYLFNFGNLSEEVVDEWIRLAQSMGVTQIDFHGGSSFRFGDCEPNPTTYPRGRASFKAVIDKLHAAGIQAGMQTYAFFIAKNCPWVTPVPDPRLGKDATFTLAEPLAPDAVTVPVQESTKTMSAVTGFFVRNSVTLQIDDELITYSDVSEEPPYAFKQCRRGAYGTRVTPHAKGAKVHHLRECFGLFVPDGESTLFAEVAAKAAEMFNECGFDMIYLDALDGEDVVAGPENGWHYGAKFVFEIWKRLKRPAMMEMSTFHHHLWYVRSRLGAWDHPERSHKKFIDIHCTANEECRRMFLPSQLGWWAFKMWSGAQGEPTFTDDIEYLCGKALANDTGLSFMGIDPTTVTRIPALPRLAGIVQRYETLRRKNYFTQAVKDKLRVPGDEFTLVQAPDGEWQFRRVQHARHKVEGLSWSSEWKVRNQFDRQPLELRIEALLSAGPYDAPTNVTLADFARTTDFTEHSAPSGITAKIEPSPEVVKVGPVSGRYSAASAMATPRGAWSKIGKKFSPYANLSGHQALGVWVHGDGKGEVLNIQVKSPVHLRGDADHYVVVDFTGWRYFELVESEGARHADYSWPYGDIYSIYREPVQYASVESLNVFFNNIPPNDTVTCYLSPIRAVPTVKSKLRNPAITIAGKTISFPVEIETGSYLEFRTPTDCKLYGPQGELLSEVKPQGDVPILEPGENQLKFACEPTAGVNPRAYVTAISHGEILRGTRSPKDK